MRSLGAITTHSSKVASPRSLTEQILLDSADQQSDMSARHDARADGQAMAHGKERFHGDKVEERKVREDHQLHGGFGEQAPRAAGGGHAHVSRVRTDHASAKAEGCRIPEV